MDKILGEIKQLTSKVEDLSAKVDADHDERATMAETVKISNEKLVETIAKNEKMVRTEMELRVKLQAAESGVAEVVKTIAEKERIIEYLNMQAGRNFQAFMHATNTPNIDAPVAAFPGSTT